MTFSGMFTFSKTIMCFIKKSVRLFNYSSWYIDHCHMFLINIASAIPKLFSVHCFITFWQFFGI